MAKQTPEQAAQPAPLGVSIVAGEPSEPDGVLDGFQSINPATGQQNPTLFHPASPVQVNDAANAAWRAFHQTRHRGDGERAEMLELIARRIGGIADAIAHHARLETGLPEDRLRAELERTTSTLEMYASVLRDGDWRRLAIDQADPGRKPKPRPGLRSMLIPLGPIAVFGASNFPLAYSTAGTDAASALAAGCPVIIKGHPLHPATGELVAQAVVGAVRDAGYPGGWFSFLHAGGGREQAIGTELVKHPCVRAAGFTGSFGGGTALARLASERPDPIPFYAEMGATNPAFILPGGAATEPNGIAQHLAGAITDYAGQQCTCPGLVFLVHGSSAESLIERLEREIDAAPPAPMLAARIRRRYLERLEAVAITPGVRVVAGDAAGIRGAASRVRDSQPTHETGVLLRTTSDVFVEQETLQEEIFGPAALVVECEGPEAMLRCAGVIQGSLAGSIFLANEDVDLARAMVDVLSMRVGRIVFNGVPTGVEVGHATVHGGPSPATNRPDTTAVGPRSLERWCRPVSFQNAPAVLLPAGLRDENPRSVFRRVNGSMSQEPIKPRRS